MAIRNVPLKAFMKRSQAASTSKLPWMHTTQAFQALEIIADRKILATRCSVFHGEDLCYLFVGRPAYKYDIEDGETPFYLLPVVFVIRFHVDPNIKRVNPFDSGAFKRKLFPQYMTAFDFNMFELEPHRSSIGETVNTFFGSDQAYMKRTPHPIDELTERHSILPNEAPVHAIARLYQDKGSDRFDDRAAAIEVQIPSAVELTNENLLGVVMPDEYKRQPGLIEDIRTITSNVELYSMHPMNISHYWASVSDAVARIYKKSGIIL